MIYTVDVLHC